LSNFLRCCHGAPSCRTTDSATIPQRLIAALMPATCDDVHPNSRASA
jgi:hypothetical protein